MKKKETKKTKPPKVGRPKWIPPKIDDVEALATRGLTEKQIAEALGVCYDTLNERKKEFPEFSAAIKRGKAKGIGVIASKLYQSAVKGSLGAQIFFLKCQGGWKETNVHELQGKDGKELPAPMATVVVLPANGRD